VVGRQPQPVMQGGEASSVVHHVSPAFSYCVVSCRLKIAVQCTNNSNYGLQTKVSSTGESHATAYNALAYSTMLIGSSSMR
jgi:hypothetical protein